MSENEIRHRTATRLRQGIILPPVVAFSLHFIFTPILFGKLSSSPLLFAYYALCLGTVLIIINIFIGKWKHGADIPLGKIYTRSYLVGVLMVGIGSQVALVLDGSISFQVIAIRAFWMLAIASLMYACTALWFTHQVRHMPAEDLAGSLSVPLRDKFISVFLFIFLLSMTIVNVIHYKAEVRIVSAQKTAALRASLTATAQTVQNAFANHASLASDVAATEAPRGKKKRTDDAFSLLYRDLPLPVARAAVFGGGATNAWERRQDGLNPIDGSGTWPQAHGFFADGTNMYYASTAAAVRSACILADARDIRQLMVTSFPGVKLYLADASGKTVVSSDGAMPVFTKHALASTNGHDMMAVGGKQHAVFAAPIASNAAVMLAVPATEIFAAKALDDVALYAALTLWISVIAVGAAVVIVLRIFLGPLERARDISRELAQGKGDLTRRISVKTNDEIGELLFYFNKFIDTMNFIVNNIKSGTMNLNTDLSRMQVTVEETAKVSAAEIESIERSVASVEEIMRSIGQVGTTTEQQKNAFASVNIAIDELLKSILRISENMQKQSVSISETSSAIEQMTSNILSVAKNVGNADAFAKRLLSEAKTGGDRVDDLVDAIREVEESSSQINEIITVIQSIAEQTNLLAMNAAIEAAHAGEHGKGFAVVADEIRKLAENTAANSQSITVIVKDIATRIEKIVGLAVESGTSLTTILDASGSTANIIAEITAANNELETGGRDILETVKNLNQITDEVKASVDEQMQSGNVVESQVTLLDRITTEVATSINENSIGAREITESMEALRAIAVKNKQGTSELSSAIGGIAENFSRFVSLVAAFKTSEAEKHPELESPTAARELPAPDDAAR